VLGGIDLGEELEKPAYRLVPYGVRAHRLVENHAVVDAPALSTGRDVSRLAQIAQDQGDPRSLSSSRSAMSRTRSPGSLSFANRSRPWLVSSEQSAKVSQSLRLVERRPHLKDDTGSPLQRT